MDKRIKQKLDAMAPFNINLLNLTASGKYKLYKEVTSPNMFTGGNQEIHPEGLWSNEIFGAMGTPERLQKKSYISLHIPVIHPRIYKEIYSGSKLLIGIMSGERYAKYNKTTNLFEESNALEGETGMYFFLSHWDTFTLPESGSDKRTEAIKLIDKFRQVALVDKWPVLSAGFRDVEFKDGHVSHDEVNNIYRQVMSLASTIQAASFKSDLSLVDGVRFSLQKTLVELHNHISDVTGNGKKKIIRGNWTSRVIFGSTRNVITASSPSGRFAEDPNNLGYNDCMVGMFQALVANEPFCVRAIRESFVMEKMPSPIEPARLINKKSLKEELVMLSTDWYSLLQSNEGIKKLIQQFRPAEIAHRIMEVEGRYLALIYRSPTGGIRILNDIGELPKHLDKNDVSPMTFFEFLYITCYEALHDVPGYMCRYPATGIESDVPAFTKVFTTIRSEKKHWLNEDFEVDKEKMAMARFPINGETPVTSMAPPIAALSKMDGDHDGDQLNYVAFQTKEAREEIIHYKTQKRAYVDQSGEFRYPLDYDTLKFICTNLTSEEG